MANGITLNWILTVVLVPLVFGAYIYTHNVDLRAEEREQTVKQEIQQQTQEIKKDLKEQISESERRVQEALKELKELVKQGNGRSQ